MEKLPDELITHILSFLSPSDIVHFQLVSRRFLQTARDDNLWKLLCFEDSQAEALRKRREALYQDTSLGDQETALRRAANNIAQRLLGPVESLNVSDGNHSHQVSDSSGNEVNTVERRRKRALANWEPSYGLGRIDWYEDYIHRHAPISLGWLQQPCTRAGKGGPFLEARSMGTLTDSIDELSENQSTVVAPLDDGSVCLWSLHGPGSQHKYGSIMGQSRANLLGSTGDYTQKGHQQQPSFKSQRNTSVMSQSVSVDNVRKTAFFAVEDLLTEVDLQTLQLVSTRQFPESIAAISEGSPFLPLTIGTHDRLYLHDSRVRGSLDFSRLGNTSRCDLYPESHASGPRYGRLAPLFAGKSLLDHSSLLEPGPVSILHVPGQGGTCDIKGTIYVAGRFPSILYYDRRMWPKLSSAIHSGARLSGLTHVPALLKAESQGSPIGPFGEASQTRTEGSTTTLIACGEYKGRGSLELYGLSSYSAVSGASSEHSNKLSQVWTVKNRHTASRSKLLSVATHGTRIVFSDGDGFVKWVESDGSMEVRQWSLNQKVNSEPHRLFSGDTDSGDVVRKILPTKPMVNQGEHRVNDSQLLIWTGERIGILSFSRRSVVETFEWGVGGSAGEAEVVSEEHRIYNQMMRSTLERQADEARFMRGLGLI